MKDDKIYLYHIRDAINLIIEYTQQGNASYMKDRKTQDAVVRQLEIIGEASKNISNNLRSKTQKIPWKKMAGMRDKMIHEYFGVNLKLVWDVVEKEIPKLKKEIELILSESS